MCSSDLASAPSDEEAALWLQRSASLGNAAAQHNLALLYLQGRGVLRDRAIATMWLERAAAQGWEPAREKLAVVTAATPIAR